MTKTTKTEAELTEMAMVELKAHLDCPAGMAISVLRWGKVGVRRQGRSRHGDSAWLSRMRRDARADRRPSEQAIRRA
jgi:hypothetical protein